MGNVSDLQSQRQARGLSVSFAFVGPLEFETHMVPLHEKRLHSFTLSLIMTTIGSKNNFVLAHSPSLSSAELDPIKIAHVHTCLLQNNEWIHVCEVLHSNCTTILFRTYSEFWSLHRFIMDSNPKLAGELGERKIPFMDPPSRKLVNEELALNRCQRLNLYLNTVTKLNLDCDLNGHPFFERKDKDYADSMFKNSAHLFHDLLQFDALDEKAITVKIYYNDTSHVWRQEGQLTLKGLESVIMTFVPRFKKIYYRNEFQEKNLLASEAELRLLSYKRLKLVFTVK